MNTHARCGHHDRDSCNCRQLSPTRNCSNARVAATAPSTTLAIHLPAIWRRNAGGAALDNATRAFRHGLLEATGAGRTSTHTAPAASAHKAGAAATLRNPEPMIPPPPTQTKAPFRVRSTWSTRLSAGANTSRYAEPAKICGNQPRSAVTRDRDEHRADGKLPTQPQESLLRGV